MNSIITVLLFLPLMFKSIKRSLAPIWSMADGSKSKGNSKRIILYDLVVVMVACLPIPGVNYAVLYLASKNEKRCQYFKI